METNVYIPMGEKDVQSPLADRTDGIKDIIKNKEARGEYNRKVV